MKYHLDSLSLGKEATRIENICGTFLLELFKDLGLVTLGNWRLGYGDREAYFSYHFVLCEGFFFFFYLHLLL